MILLIATAHASVVQTLLDAGATLHGKTNLDQFACGLNGTRSPYGAVPNAINPLYVSGGSSSGSAYVVATGQVDFALGTDIRQESYLFSGTPVYTCVSNFSPANIALPNSVMGCAGNSTSPERSRDIKAVFAELMIPVTKELIVQAAVRHDQHETVGGTTNPKLAFRFTPTKEVLVRGSAGTGCRAPTVPHHVRSPCPMP